MEQEIYLANAGRFAGHTVEIKVSEIPQVSKKLNLNVSAIPSQCFAFRDKQFRDMVYIEIINPNLGSRYEAYIPLLDDSDPAYRKTRLKLLEQLKGAGL